MKFEKLTLENLERDAEHFNIDENDEYIYVYPQFLDFVQEIKDFSDKELVICSHLIYSWMPTIPVIRKPYFKKLKELLQSTRSSLEVSDEMLESGKKCINNSYVGLSKLLHFVNPNYFAIWDSRVLSYLRGKHTISNDALNRLSNFNAYQEQIRWVVKDKRFQALNQKVNEACTYDVSALRAAEMIMFQYAKKNYSFKY